MQRGTPIKIAAVCSSLLLLSAYVWYQTRAVATQPHIPADHSAASSPPTQPNSSPLAQTDQTPILLPGSKSRSTLFTLPIKRETYVTSNLRQADRFDKAPPTTAGDHPQDLYPGSPAYAASKPPVSDRQLLLPGSKAALYDLSPEIRAALDRKLDFENASKHPELTLPKSQDLTLQPTPSVNATEPESMMLPGSKSVIITAARSEHPTTQPASNPTRPNSPKP